jgi:hypothetical protein
MLCPGLFTLLGRTTASSYIDEGIFVIEQYCWLIAGCDDVEALRRGWRFV